MSSPYRTGTATWSFGGPLTPGVKYLLISTIGAYVLQLLYPPFTAWFRLDPSQVLGSFHVWRLVTYVFLHGGLFHVLINMLILFMFGCEMERMWGTRFFLRYYFLCGVGAGLFALLTPYPVVGASGAIYGLLVAFAMHFPTRVIYMNVFFIFFFPIQAKYFVIIMGLISFLSSIGGASGVSHLAHLGGLVVGYLYLRLGGVRSARRAGASSGSPGGFVQDTYRRWRMKRLRKKFEQYYQKRSGGGNGPRYTIH
ncbi:MAG: rhomboid family intramembrane serine protease [Vicinamibacteria bacterium]